MIPQFIVKAGCPVTSKMAILLSISSAFASFSFILAYRLGILHGKFGSVDIINTSSSSRSASYSPLFLQVMKMPWRNDRTILVFDIFVEQSHKFT